MGWVGGMMGAIGSGFKSTGKNAEIRASNKFYGNLYHPQNVNAYANGLNPWIGSVLGYQPQQGWGSFTRRMGFDPRTSPIYGDLQKIASGQDISKYLMNQPLNQINQGYNNNLQRAQSMLGRSAGGGGLANTYALANQAGRTNATANLYQNYGQWREQQRRSDINWLLGQWGGAQGNAMNLLQSYGNKWQQPANFATVTGDNIQAFMAGASGGMGGGDQSGGSIDINKLMQMFKGMQGGSGGNTIQSGSTPNFGSSGSWGI